MNCRSFTACISLALLLSGCLEREEIIKVADDGSVQLETVFDGDSSDFVGGDAVPNEPAGWRVRQEQRTDEQSNTEKMRLRARMEVRAGQALPQAYAAPNEALFQTCLRFPTHLKVEQRGDGKYYHFRRVYQAREAARYDYYQKRLEEGDGGFKEIMGKNSDEMGDDERAKLVEGLRAVETGKRTEFLRAGAKAMGDKWPQHFGLVAEGALRASYLEADLSQILDLMAQPASPERDQAIDAASKDWIRAGDDAVTRALRELRVPREQLEQFRAGVAEDQQRRAITEDLNDEKWTVKLFLPGELIAHNGDAVEEGAVVWTFEASAIMDREQVLMATSRVGR